MFDQIIITQNLLNETNGLNYKGSHVFVNSDLIVNEGKYAGYPFRTYVGKRYDGGYSDHFPVYMMLEKN